MAAKSCFTVRFYNLGPGVDLMNIQSS